MKTLIVRFGSLGDLVLTLPTLRDLKLSDQGDIHFLVHRRFAPLLDHLPEIDTIWNVDQGQGPQELWQLARRLRRERFDLVLDLHDNLRSRSLRLLMGPGPIWVRTRRDDLRRRLMLTGRWHPPMGRDRPLTPVWQRHRLALARTLGNGYIMSPEQPYPVSPEVRSLVDGELVDLGLPQGGTALGIAPGAAWPAKVWPRFKELLATVDDGTPVLLFGGPQEERICRELARGNRAIPYCGDRPLPQVAAAISRCRILVTGDTGLGHLAEAVGIPVISLFGPTVPAFGFPPRRDESRVIEREMECRPCSLHGSRPCRLAHRDCLGKIDVERVLETMREMGESWI